MDRQQVGWLALIGAIGAFLGLMALELSKMHGWEELNTPAFIGTALGHLATVIAAWLGGRYMPQPRKSTRTRLTDKAHLPPTARNFEKDTLADE